MSELVKNNNGDWPKRKYSKKELKKMSKVLKPLENILNEHYTKHIMSKYGDITKKEYSSSPEPRGDITKKE